MVNIGMMTGQPSCGAIGLAVFDQLLKLPVTETLSACGAHTRKPVPF